MADDQAERVTDYGYDLIVIGSGPGGQKAAIAAAKLGKRVAAVDRQDMVGGVCVNTGTIPSKTLREAVLYLTGMSQRDLYGASYRVKQEITIADLMARTQHVVTREMQVVRAQLVRNHVDLHTGTGRFLDPHTVAVAGVHRGDRTTLSASHLVIATGTRPARPDHVDFVRREGRARRDVGPCDGHHPGQRQADPGRRGDVLGGPAGHDGGAGPRGRRRERRTRAGGCRSTSTTAPRCRTSTRSGT